ncbi:J domain-containing protein [Spirochaeta africana]|nr:J domain-containing protein [Spirochaeta africana]
MNVATAFQFLQLPQGASLEDAGASYRRLLKEYHPDRNIERSEWSHKMTVRLTEAYDAVTAYLQDTARQARTQQKPASEPDSGYSLVMQTRIAKLYDIVLDVLHSYYTMGMDNVYLRQEGTLRYRYRATMRRLAATIDDLKETLEWPGSALQHQQARAIHGFAGAFYENMLIKPLDHAVPAGDERKAQRLYHQGSRALDEAIRHGVLELRTERGLICPGARHQAEKSFMLILAGFAKSSHVPLTMIKLYLLRALSALCEHLEQGQQQ